MEYTEGTEATEGTEISWRSLSRAHVMVQRILAGFQSYVILAKFLLNRFKDGEISYKSCPADSTLS